MLLVLILIASLLTTPIEAMRKNEFNNQAVQKIAEPVGQHLIPAEIEGGLPRDSKDHQVVLLGATTREAFLTHRDIYRDNTRRRDIKAGWMARWKSIEVPCTLVVIFGSWCSDSQAELPDLLALTKEPNPFVTIQYIGVYRDKKVDIGAWPKGIVPQVVEKVPTIWLFELQADGTQKLLGSIVETPPRGQRMAEAVLDLLALAR